MTPQEFCYWLQGCFEISGDSVKALDEKQVQIIKNHLNLVFEHAIDPQYGDEAKQQVLQEIHDTPPPGFNPPHRPGGTIRC